MRNNDNYDEIDELRTELADVRRELDDVREELSNCRDVNESVAVCSREDHMKDLCEPDLWTNHCVICHIEELLENAN
jgi:uncharacterized membrane protein